ncbi:MAG TPA: hypothetical protein V6D31_05180 [Candidatus Sericytochromatia bacterium]|jgi:hypothetical protein
MTTMINGLLQARILGAVVLLLVFGSLMLAVLDPSTRPMFGDLTKVVVAAYIGRYMPAPGQKSQQR